MNSSCFLNHQDELSLVHIKTGHTQDNCMKAGMWPKGNWSILKFSTSPQQHTGPVANRTSLLEVNRASQASMAKVDLLIFPHKPALLPLFSVSVKHQHQMSCSSQKHQGQLLSCFSCSYLQACGLHVLPK